VLGRIRGSPVLAHTFVVPTSIVPVSVSAQVGDAIPDRAPYAFVIRSPAGGPLVIAEVSPDDLAQARARWRSRTWAAVWSVLAIALLLCAGPLVELRWRSRDRRLLIIATVGLILSLAASRLVFLLRAVPIVGP